LLKKQQNTFIMDITYIWFTVTELLKGLDVTAEVARLQEQRALGPNKHRKQVCKLCFISMLT
jgi:hypothetical protein